MDELQHNIDKICHNTPDVHYPDVEEMSVEDLKDRILGDFEKIYEAKEAEVGEAQMREVERGLLLRIVDSKWIDHIDAMDQLKQGIGLRSIGHQDPAAAYAQEGFEMFNDMVRSIKDDMVRYCFDATITTSVERKEMVSENANTVKMEFVDDAASQAQGVEAPLDGPINSPGSQPKQETIRRATPKVGRNDPCPCGSGKKYKNCCGREV